MRYKTVVTGVFHSRPNRFIALVDVGGREEVCHVKNTGRCRELLLPGAQVVLSVSVTNPEVAVILCHVVPTPVVPLSMVPRLTAVPV